MPNEPLQPFEHNPDPVQPEPAGSGAVAVDPQLPGLEKPGNKPSAPVAGPPKPAGKKRGRPIIHGKYAAKQPASLAGNRPAFVEEDSSPADPAAAAPVQAAAPSPAFALSRDVAEPYLDLARELVEMTGSTWQRMKIFKTTKNREFAGLVSKKVPMSEGMAGTFKTALFAVCEKRRWDLSQSPEWALGLTLAAYLQTVNESANAAIAKFMELHPEVREATPQHSK